MPYGNPLAGQALAPGSKVIVKSLASGKYCQVIMVEQKNHIICNVTSSESATPLEFTGGQPHWVVQELCSQVHILDASMRTMLTPPPAQPACHEANVCAAAAAAATRHSAGTGVSFQQQGFSNYGTYEPLEIQLGGVLATLQPSEWEQVDAVQSMQPLSSLLAVLSI